MIAQALNGLWQFRQINTSDWLPATVPGSVHTDLLALDRIPDPFVGDNEKRVQWVAEADWEYRRTFVEQSADFSTDGNYGLKVNATAGGWFGLDFPAPIDLSAKGNLRFDLKTLSVGTSKEVALKVGDSWAWCEGGGWSWIPAETTTTVDLNLLTDLGCAAPDLSKVQAIYVWFSGPGTFYIDYVRGE